MNCTQLSLAVLLLTVPALAGAAPERIRGPVEAEVLTVKDGDTIAVRAHIWPGHYVEVAVRLAGIDTPEIRGKCDRERDLAQKARDSLAQWTASGRVLLTDVTYDKYGGRAVAKVGTDDGSDVASRLIQAGLAYPYEGRTKQGWC
ncbi:Nuclease (SNase domain protein) [Magnetospirillum sp. LM-5]|uniref:thermonuclease family protein n=1 Tax=Magnetospirillum sp. LM-5 TaxID=2681466 RepID=UPI001384F7E3|nr:thermonuclease family protein [Magnetospirillum sp. LM-5]CAA7614735.1 Nuclease (SNase domain protein) [Magnetospirillum sp. LM-5]